MSACHGVWSLALQAAAPVLILQLWTSSESFALPWAEVTSRSCGGTADSAGARAARRAPHRPLCTQLDSEVRAGPASAASREAEPRAWASWGRLRARRAIPRVFRSPSMPGALHEEGAAATEWTDY